MNVHSHLVELNINNGIWNIWLEKLCCFQYSPGHSSFITYNAAGVGRRQDPNVTHFVKNVNILEFGYYTWNPYEKYIQKSPNMPDIG